MTDEEPDDDREDALSESPDNLSEISSNEQLVSELERTLNSRAAEVEKVMFTTQWRSGRP